MTYKLIAIASLTVFSYFPSFNANAIYQIYKCYQVKTTITGGGLNEA